MKHVDSLELLRGALADVAPGKLDNRAAKIVVAALVDAWPGLDGSDRAKTKDWKIKRWENPEWDPPLLMFDLERHGGTVQGSAYAGVHRWTLNVEAGTPELRVGGRRQVDAKDPKLDVVGLARQCTELITTGAQHGWLIWRDAQRQMVTIQIGRMIPDTKKQTTAGRRKRFRRAIEPMLRDAGWLPVAGTAANTWKRSATEE